MPTIKLKIIVEYFIFFIVLILLQACNNKRLLISEISTNHQGVITQSIKIIPDETKRSKEEFFICFSEIKFNKIIGLSCQNDTGFHLFSGGLVEDKFELDDISKFLLKVNPEMVLNYLRIALFSEYIALNKIQYEFKVTKTQNTTTILDMEKQQTVELNIL